MSKMTINELIKALSEMGDEKFRDTATVRVCNLDNQVADFWDESYIDPFYVRQGINTADLFIDPS